MRRLSVAVAVASAAFVVAGCGGAHHANASMRPGGILASGGELVGCVVADLPRSTAVRCRPAGTNSAQRGLLVTVSDTHGHNVRHQRIRPGHGFHFVLLPGHYRVGFVRRGHREGLCPQRVVTVHPGRTTHQNFLIGGA